MDLMKFKTIDQTIRATMFVAVSCCVAISLSFGFAFWYLSNKIDEAYTKALVLDTGGRTYDVTSVAAADMRKYEYEDHIKTFVTKWYAFDESTYENNVQSALALIGNRGKELLSDYNDINMLNSLIQKNIIYSVTIKDLSVDMRTIPISGEITFVQTGYRARGSVSRDVVARFTLYDVSRSRENSHGVKIEGWDVKYTSPTPSAVSNE
jgi:hypothetical protein